MQRNLISLWHQAGSRGSSVRAAGTAPTQQAQPVLPGAETSEFSPGCCKRGRSPGGRLNFYFYGQLPFSFPYGQVPSAPEGGAQHSPYAAAEPSPQGPPSAFRAAAGAHPASPALRRAEPDPTAASRSHGSWVRHRAELHCRCFPHQTWHSGGCPQLRWPPPRPALPRRGGTAAPGGGCADRASAVELGKPLWLSGRSAGIPAALRVTDGGSKRSLPQPLCGVRGEMSAPRRAEVAAPQKPGAVPSSTVSFPVCRRLPQWRRPARDRGRFVPRCGDKRPYFFSVMYPFLSDVAPPFISSSLSTAWFLVVLNEKNDSSSPKPNPAIQYVPSDLPSTLLLPASWSAHLQCSDWVNAVRCPGSGPGKCSQVWGEWGFRWEPTKWLWMLYVCLDSKR